MQRHVLALLNHFGQRYPVGLALPRGENWAAEEARNFRLSLSAGFSPGRDLLSCWRCYLLLRKVRPALLHIHGFKTFLVGAPAARLAGAPVLVTVHNFPAHQSGMIMLPPLSRLSALAGAHYIAVSGVYEALTAGSQKTKRRGMD
jgi:hypothetical protein